MGGTHGHVPNAGTISAQKSFLTEEQRQEDTVVSPPQLKQPAESAKAAKRIWGQKMGRVSAAHALCGKKSPTYPLLLVFAGRHQPALPVPVDVVPPAAEKREKEREKKRGARVVGAYDCWVKVRTASCQRR